MNNRDPNAYTSSDAPDGEMQPQATNQPVSVFGISGLLSAASMCNKVFGVLTALGVVVSVVGLANGQSVFATLMKTLLWAVLLIVCWNNYTTLDGIKPGGPLSDLFSSGFSKAFFFFANFLFGFTFLACPVFGVPFYLALLAMAKEIKAAKLQKL